MKISSCRSIDAQHYHIMKETEFSALKICNNEIFCAVINGQKLYEADLLEFIYPDIHITLNHQCYVFSWHIQNRLNL